MAELNGSSYYRANPFYQQGYMPDIAYKNRKASHYMVELPQGKEHFEPSNRKHFQRAGYYTTIGDEHLMDPDAVSSPGREKSQYRNLNVEDIEGANTNTLISKAVKNRMKAKEYLVERDRALKEEEAREKMRKYEQKEDDRKRLEALSKINRLTEPNYHEKVMKMKTEESEQQYQSPPQPKKEEFINREHLREKQSIQTQTEPIRPQKQEPVQTKFHARQYEDYQRQLEKTDREIRELENQLQESRHADKLRQQGNHYSMPAERKNSVYRQEPRYEEIQKHLIPQTYRREDPRLPPNGKVGAPEHQYKQFSRREGDLDHRERDIDHRESYPRNHQPQERRELSNFRNHSGHLEPQNKLRSFTDHPQQEATYQGARQAEPQRGIESPIYDQRSQVKQTREQHRKINPTYLSYGSAAIGLAGRNIVGY